ncbi:TonB-dependent receptor [Aridibaculum aurantiacum]|uniref:TonB-dependent receptor n=1 Tax=Aridibaculum aurantiacum TaxID=2810307 RepID=UPI001A96967E|nr:TonB-dependent receptor [Aridibaculum aurantiacum]
MRNYGLWLALIILYSTKAFATSPEEAGGSIKGTVTTTEGQPAPEVIITIKGTSRGAITDEAGGFEFRRLAPGDYILHASLVGYQTVEASATVAEGRSTDVTIQLTISTRQLQDVVVTGNRKFRSGLVSPSLRLTTPILEVSQNIQVITKGLIADQQAFDMLDGIQRNVSGAQKVEHWDNYARINMRGSQMTAFRNGINVQMPWGPLTEDMSMVERIEFIKGPAGFMLSNGEPGGFYNVVTKKPSGTNKGEVSLSLGSFDLYRATADIDGKLSADGKLLYRINVMGQAKGSHRDFEFNNRYSIVPVLKYLVDDKTSITAEFTHQFSQMNVVGSNYAFSKRRYADLPVNFTTAEPNLDPTVINDNSLLLIFEHKLNNNWKLTAQGSYLHYNQVGQSIWPWSYSGNNDSLMQRGISIWDALGINKSGQVFVNGEVATGAVLHKILGGVDMGHKDYFADWGQGAALGSDDFNIYNPQYGQVPASAIPAWDRSKSIRERGVRYNNNYASYYLQDEMAFFRNKLRLTLAGRFTTNKNINPYSGNTEDSKFTPRVGLSYSINKNTTTYAVYDQAFVANPGLDWQNRNFSPVTGDNVELGVKRDWFNGKWNTTLSVYEITRNNVLTADLEHPNPVTGQYSFNRQSGQQKTTGVEFDLKGELARNLEVVTNYAFTEARVTKDSDPALVGNQVAGATKHLHNTWLSYKLTEGKANGLRFSLGYQYQAGRSSWFVFDNSESSLPDYFRLDGAISYYNNKFGINLNVNNLLNSYLYSGGPNYGSGYYWQAEPKINSRLTISYKL